MRLWTLSPQYLDQKGLVALWREALLAKKVLEGNTKGYKNHPQLNRFKSHPDSLAAIDVYLLHVYEHATERGYSFDKNKLVGLETEIKIPVTIGQVNYEFQHLLNKLQTRDPNRFEQLKTECPPLIISIFELIDGGVEEWERV